MKICSVCQAESPDSAKFCGFCGTRFVEPRNTLICPVCQTKLPEHENFCTNCGHSFISPAVLPVRPVFDRQIIEIEQPAGGVSNRRDVVQKLIVEYWHSHPYRSIAIAAVTLLIPFCCLINSVFAVRGLIENAGAPNAKTISTLTPSFTFTSTSAVIVNDTPAPANVSAPPSPTVMLTATGTTTRFLIKTGFAGCPPADTVQEVGKVEKAVDGDTIDVALDEKTVRVRYIGIDAAENVDPNEPPQPFGLEAFQKNKELIEGKDVFLISDVSDVDADERLLRYVFAGDMFINYELVRMGYAKVYPSPPDVACDNFFLQAQQAASQAALGLWGTSLTTIPATQPAVKMAQPTQAMVQPTQAPSGNAVCECNGPDLDCKDFATGSQAQACFDYCKPQHGDIFRLDADDDGLACESN